jgi:hypothetical protein
MPRITEASTRDVGRSVLHEARAAGVPLLSEHSQHYQGPQGGRGSRTRGPGPRLARPTSPSHQAPHSDGRREGARGRGALRHHARQPKDQPMAQPGIHASTSTSRRRAVRWINLVERWFATLTEKQLRRGVHRSTRELELYRADQHAPEALRVDEDG